MAEPYAMPGRFGLIMTYARQCDEHDLTWH
jgi:hypothetical protein